MSAPSLGKYSLRPLHYVFRVNDRKKTLDFFLHQMNMTLFRHEEFNEGCEATCNGAYQNRWSKSMIGYHFEHTHFIFEIVYNYSMAGKKYEMGNELDKIVVNCPATGSNLAENFEYSSVVTHEPDQPHDLTQVHLNILSTENAEKFWKNLLDLPFSVGPEKTGEQPEKLVTLDLENVKMVLHDRSSDKNFKLNRAQTGGRTAFSAPTKFVQEIRDQAVKFQASDNLNFLHTDHVKLDTPGKATVEVVILQTAEGHEVCIVGEEAFRELSEYDPESLKIYEKMSKKFG